MASAETTFRGSKVRIDARSATSLSPPSSTPSTRPIRPAQQKRRQGKKPQKAYPIRVFASSDSNRNAFAMFQAACQNPKRYAVHLPNCDCDKVERVLARQLMKVPNVEANDEDGDEGRNDSRVRVPDTDFDTVLEDRPDGLLILPDVSRPRAIYMCLGSNETSFRDDPKKAEMKLYDEIFPARNIDQDSLPWKLRCAACLLQGHERNGFATVCSQFHEVVNAARDQAREAAADLSVLHEDRAHHIVTVPRHMLERLHLNSRTRSQKQEALAELAGCLIEQGVPVELETHTIMLQMHLLELLRLTRGGDSSDKGRNDEGERSMHWLVMVFDDTDNHGKEGSGWSLDLPGGKRNLGETSMEAAIRETKEEIALEWDERWIRAELPGKSGYNFFLLEPPASVLE